jgi:lysophosphatidylcholine acyltransferase/lyso-PAF acetyltransferase
LVLCLHLSANLIGEIAILLNKHNAYFILSWCYCWQVRHVIFLLCQFVNYIEVVRLPIYYPSQQEMDDPKLYADNVRRLMATEVCIYFG